MKWELDDTTSDGIRFLFVGAGGLLVLRLLYAGVLMLMGVPEGDELGAAIAQFRNGYWISDADVLVTTTNSIGTRLALALSVTFVGALVAAILVHMLAKLAHKDAAHLSLFVLRASLVLALTWSVFASLLLPPSIVVLNMGGLTTTRRPALFGVLSLPWAVTETTYAWSTVQSISVEETEGGSTIYAVLHDERLPLTTGAKDDAKLQELAELIEARYLYP